MEQIAIALFVVYAVATLLIYKQKKHICPLFLIAISANLIIILLCPCNKLRYASEVKSWFPDFIELSFWQKISMGLGSTLYEVLWGNIYIFTFSCFFITCILLLKKNKLWRLSLIPLIVSLFKNIFLKTYEHLNYLSMLRGGYESEEYIYGSITKENYMNAVSYLPIIMFTFVIVVYIYVLYQCFASYSFGAWMICCMFVGAIGIRCILCFSPTIWASTFRTFIPTIGILIIICYLLYIEWRKMLKDYFIFDSIYTIAFILSSISLADTIF